MGDAASLHRIAVLSDTHGMLRPEVIQILRSAEMILHCGDFADQGTFEKLKSINGMMAVRGNCDGSWAEALPDETLFELYGKTIYMIHNKKKVTRKAEAADLIIYGHSHKYKEKSEDGKLWLNPGSCGPQRMGRPATMAVLEFDAGSGRMEIQRIDLIGDTVQEQSEGSSQPDLRSGNLREAVELVVADLQKGKTVDKIIKKRKLSRELTEQICQIYFTHPGVDVEGVLNRMELRRELL